jgi:DNA-3-methyladenine glycosylase
MINVFVKSSVMTVSPLPVSFYNRNAAVVARDLLGRRLVRFLDEGDRIAGIITETEAYVGESDLACHARAGETARTKIMYGPPGRVYMYFIYGMHWMLNCVTDAAGSPAAVLIRAIIPYEGLEQIAANRRGTGENPVKPKDWANGPARLCQALRLNGQFNGADLTDPASQLLIEPGQPVEDANVLVGPRVGIDSVPEPWRSMPWRFRIDSQRQQKFPVL